MANHNKSLGEKIREYRQKKGMTQDALAAELHISSQAVSKWENGLTSPDISLLIPLSGTLGVEVNDLLGGGRRDELERAWHKTWPLGDELSLVFAEEALKEFPNDETFLYRRACDEYFLGVNKNVSEEQRELYLLRADYHFTTLHNKYPEQDTYTSFLAQVCHVRGKRDRALELIYTCKKSESRERLIAEILGGEDEIKYKKSKIDNLVWELFRKLENQNTRESIASARSLIELFSIKDKEELTRSLNYKEAELRLADGDVDGYLKLLDEVYDSLDGGARSEKLDLQPLYDDCGAMRKPLVKELDGMIGTFLAKSGLVHPSSRELRRKLVDAAVKIENISKTNWKNYFTFCYRHVRHGDLFRYSTEWDMTSEENAALDAVFTNYYKEMRPLAVAYTIEAYRREVERLFGVGAMTGFVAKLDSCPVLGYCNCGSKEKYKNLSSSWCHCDLPDGTKVFSIVDVLVANSFTLCGLEEKLIDSAMREAQTAGYTHVEAYPSESLCGEAFDVLVAYYESIGFVTVRDLTNEDDGRSFMMRKAL